MHNPHGLFVASNVHAVRPRSMIFLPKFDPEMIIKLMARATRHDGRADLLHAAVAEPVADEGYPPSTCGCSFRAPGRWLADNHTASGRRGTGHAVLER